jgi:GNAT superfamily N-acetyltransferase
LPGDGGASGGDGKARLDGAAVAGDNRGMQSVRPADAADLPELRRIVDAAYEKYVARIGKRPGPMLDDYAARIRAHQVWVIEDGGAVAGLIVLLGEPDFLLLDNVAVDPAMQGRGVGGALMRFAEREAVRRGYCELRLYTHLVMTENQEMYVRLGWAETGRGTEHGYDRVFFRKALS